MPYLAASGIVVPTASLTVDGHQLRRERTPSGDAVLGTLPDTRPRPVSIVTGLLPPDEAQWWMRVLQGAGHVWNFEAGDLVSSNGATTISSPTVVSTNPRFGSNHIARSGANVDLWDFQGEGSFGSNSATVALWHDDGTGYDHYILTYPVDAGPFEKYVNGVRNDSATLPFSIGASTLQLTADGDFDDIVILPDCYTPQSIAEQWPQSEAFSELPDLNLSGDFWVDSVAQFPTAEIDWTMDGELNRGAVLAEGMMQLAPRPEIAVTTLTHDRLESGLTFGSHTMGGTTILEHTRLELTTTFGAHVCEPVTAWTPLELRDLWAFWDPTDSANVTLNGSSQIQQIDDTSGNGRHLVDGGTEGLTIVSDTGGPDVINMSAASSTVHLEYAEGDDVSNIDAFFAYYDSQSDTQWIAAASDSTSDALFVADDGSATAAIDQDVGTPNYLIDGFLYAPDDRDEAHNISGGRHVFEAVGLTLGTSWTTFRPFNYNSTGFLFTGRVGPMICVGPGRVSPFERYKIQGYLAHKFGIQSQLPLDHPYYSSAPNTLTYKESVIDGLAGSANLVQWLDFSDASGNPQDASGNGNHASAIDAGASYQNAGTDLWHKYGINLDDTAGSDGVTCSVTGIDMANDFTAAGSCNGNSLGTTASLFNIDGGTGYILLYFTSATNLRCRYFDGTTTYDQNCTVNTGDPVAWCLAYDATAKTLDWFVNGVKQTQVTGWSTNGNSTKMMYGGTDVAGVSPYGSAAALIYTMNHHGVFDAALSDADCRELSKYLPIHDPSVIFASLETGTPLVAWWDYSDLSTMARDNAGTEGVTTAGDDVGFVEDKSTNAGAMTQSVASAKYEFKTDGIGGRRSIEWDGVNTNYLQDASNLVSTSDPWCHITVCNPGSGAGTNGTIFHPISSNNGYTILNSDINGNYAAGGVRVFNSTAAVAAGAYTEGTDIIVEVVIDGTGGDEVTIDNGTPNSIAVSTGGISGAETIRLGHSSATYKYEGEIGETIILDALPTAGEREALYEYLSVKWGLTL